MNGFQDLPDPHGGHAVGRATVRAIEDPLPKASFGSIGCFQEVRAIEPKGAIASLTATFDPKKMPLVDATTLTWFRIDRKGERFEIVESFLDVERRAIGARIREPGIYGVYGLPKHPAVFETVRLLLECFPLIQREMEMGSDRTRTTICDLILCAPGGGSGGGPPGLCEKCLGLEVLRGGLPEFEILRHKPRFGVFKEAPNPPKRLVNGRIACSSAGDIISFLPDGSDVKVLATPGPNEDFKAPSWSPDGTRLAFTVGPGPNPRVEVMNADGTGRIVAGQGGSAYGRVGWKPDGTELVFAFSPVAFVWQIDAVKPEGTGRHQLGPYPDGYNPSWSPDGRNLAFARPGLQSGVYVGDPAATAPNDMLVAGSNGALAVEWSRSGRFLLVLLGGDFQVIPMNGATASGPPVPLGVTAFGFGSASFSPLGDRLCGFRYDPSLARTWVADFDEVKALAGQPAVTNVQDVHTGINDFYPHWQPSYV